MKMVLELATGANDNLCSQSFTARDFNVHMLPKDRRQARNRKGKTSKGSDGGRKGGEGGKKREKGGGAG